MLTRLQQKWKVSGGRLLLIITTFAVGGSLCGYAGRKLLGMTALEKGLIWVILYIVLITILWPLSVMLVSIPLGQFNFFKKYIKRIFLRMSGQKTTPAGILPIHIGIFASGAGTNAQKIIETLPGFFDADSGIAPKIAVVVSDKPGAGVHRVATSFSIPTETIQLLNINAEEAAALYFAVLKKHKIDFIVLAGYLKMIPAAVIKEFPGKIVNIHPALLPSYGGPGMYGRHVHEAVIKGGAKQSGISIHYVDEKYDSGEIVFSTAIDVAADESPETLADKIHLLEHEHYPAVIAKILHTQNSR